MNENTIVLAWEDVFPDFEFGQHGQKKVTLDGDDVTVVYNTGGHLLEFADFSDGSSSMGATLGDDRNIEVIAPNGRILGVLEYRNGLQPSLKVDGKPVEGGSNRFTSFVSETGAADEDPAPQSVRSGDLDDPHGGEEYFVNRNTGQAAWCEYRVRVYYLDPPYEDRTSLTLQHNGHTPQTDTTYPKPAVQANYCPHCGGAQ